MATVIEKFKKLLNLGVNKPKRRNPVQYGGLSDGDIFNWRELAQGPLQKLGEEEANAILRSLASIEGKEFIARHEEATKEIDYEDPFKEPLERLIEKTNQKIKMLQGKLQTLQMEGKSQFTEEDWSFIENIAVLLGQEASLGGSKPSEKDSPMKRLRNQLGVWKLALQEFQQQYGNYYAARPGAEFHPVPRIS